MKENTKTKIHKLPQDLVNKIAAGEVVERPASVVKELLDNSIDANSTRIEIHIEKGGRSLIKVIDNGYGMSAEDLVNAFEPHSTSKISSIEDLNDLLTLGFRGEALSTIIAVSELTAISMTGASSKAHKIEYHDGRPSDVIASAGVVGTTIEVRDIFKSIPAREKYLRSDESEYRAILSILIPYFLYRSDIHFIFYKDGREIYNLPAISDAQELTKERIIQVVRSDFTKELLPIHFDGNGIKIEGFITSPTNHVKKNAFSVVYVNGRSIRDSGITRSVLEGYSTFIPKGEKIPYIISLELTSGMVDLNVHPRKEEVKFMNPFRIYTAVEQAVGEALREGFGSSKMINNTDTADDIAYERLRGGSHSSTLTKDRIQTYGSPVNKDRVEQSILFSESILNSAKSYEVTDHQSRFKEERSDVYNTEELLSRSDEIVNVFQIFKKYLVYEFEDKIKIIDQHAAAERISFERLKKHYNGEDLDIQSLLMPFEITLDDEMQSFLREYENLLQRLGFTYTIDGYLLKLEGAPAILMEADFQKMFNELIDLDFEGAETESGNTKAREEILATVACHSSIRSNQNLRREEIISIYHQLLECENPYSCPHGRPIVWEMSLSQIDSNFDRTY